MMVMMPTVMMIIFTYVRTWNIHNKLTKASCVIPSNFAYVRIWNSGFRKLASPIAFAARLLSQVVTSKLQQLGTSSSSS